MKPTQLERKERVSPQGVVMEVWYECAECQSRIGDRREVLDFKFCPVCGRAFV